MFLNEPLNQMKILKVTALGLNIGVYVWRIKIQNRKHYFSIIKQKKYSGVAFHPNGEKNPINSYVLKFHNLYYI